MAATEYWKIITGEILAEVDICLCDSQLEKVAGMFQDNASVAGECQTLTEPADNTDYKALYIRQKKECEELAGRFDSLEGAFLKKTGWESVDILNGCVYERPSLNRL